MKKTLLICFMLLTVVGISNALADVQVILNVDMHGSGLTAGQPVYFAGNFGGVYGSWDAPGTNANNELTDANNDSVYSVTLTIPTGTYQFKFFKGAGWDGGELTVDPNRHFDVVGDFNTNYHWAIFDAQVIMNVDMHGSGLAAGEPVYFAGNFGGIYGSWNTPGDNLNNQLTDPNNDSIYSVTLILAPGVYAYKFFKGAGWGGGEWAGDPNRGINVVNDTTANFLWGVLIPAGIGESPLANKVSVYPVPFNNTLNVMTSADLNSISLTSANGLQVARIESPVIGTTAVNTSAFAAGMYFVTFNPKSGKSYTVKVMKY